MGTRLRFGKNAYAKSDGNKLYILNRFRSGMRCEENQMIKDSRLSRCLNMSDDVGGYCIFQKQREMMRTQRCSFTERSCFLYFQIIFINKRSWFLFAAISNYP